MIKDNFFLSSYITKTLVNFTTTLFLRVGLNLISMADTVKPILISAVDLAVQVIQASNEARLFKKEWDVVKIKVQNS